MESMYEKVIATCVVVNLLWTLADFAGLLEPLKAWMRHQSRYGHDTGQLPAEMTTEHFYEAMDAIDQILGHISWKIDTTHERLDSLSETLEDLEALNRYLKQLKRSQKARNAQKAAPQGFASLPTGFKCPTTDKSTVVVEEYEGPATSDKDDGVEEWLETVTPVIEGIPDRNSP